MDPFRSVARYDCTVTHNAEILRFIMNAPQSGHFVFLINVRTKIELYYFCPDTNRWRFYRSVTDETSLESKRVILGYHEVVDNDRVPFGSIRGALAQVGVPHPQHPQIIARIHSKAARLHAVAQQLPNTSWVKTIPILVEIARVYLQTVAKPPNESHLDHPEGAGENEDDDSEDEMASLMSTSDEDEDEDEDFDPTPTSQASIEALEKVVMVGEKGNCAICLEEMEMYSEVTRMPCAHLFHGACIVEWLEKKNVCPLCRYKMPPADAEDGENESEG